MNSKLNIGQKGISLVEVLVVLVIVSVLIVAAVAQFGDAETRFQTQNVARELKVNFERARFDSVKRRPTTVNDMARIVINDATSFSVLVDQDQNSTLEPTDTRTINFGNRGDVKIIAAGMTFPITVAFDRKGHITAIDNSGTLVTPNFIICDNCTESTITPQNSFQISVSPTGTITMLQNGETLPSHANPTTTTINGGFEVDNMLTVQNGTIPNGTPAPTPTPDPTPNPTATPTPSTATPTPTPNTRQNICQRQERPAQTGCHCQSPMTINGDGHCK